MIIDTGYIDITEDVLFDDDHAILFVDDDKIVWNVGDWSAVSFIKNGKSVRATFDKVKGMECRVIYIDGKKSGEQINKPNLPKPQTHETICT